jgi:hypothetical protein
MCATARRERERERRERRERGGRDRNGDVGTKAKTKNSFTSIYHSQYVESSGFNSDIPAMVPKISTTKQRIENTSTRVILHGGRRRKRGRSYEDIEQDGGAVLVCLATMLPLPLNAALLLT